MQECPLKRDCDEFCHTGTIFISAKICQQISHCRHVDISLSEKRYKTLLITLAHTNYVFLCIGNSTHVSNTDHINLNVVVVLAKNIWFMC